MKYIFTLIFSIITTISFALGFVDTDAHKEDPEFDKAISRGAKTKIELHVVDDEGVPVPKANVRVTLGMVTTVNIINGQTDTNGVFIIEGKTRGNEIIIQPKKEGYYNSEKTIIYWGNVNIKVKNGKWQPYGEKITVVLRKKHNPITLVTNHYSTREFKYTTTFYKWIGFDLKENDFVEPHGKGKVSDFEVMLEWDQKLDQDYTGMGLKIRFIEPYSGYYVVEKNLNSDFTSPYHAIPDNIKLTSATYYEKKIDNNWEEKKYDNNSCLVVRSRPVIDENGDLVSANYSLIYEINFCWNRDGEGGYCFYRAFNPKPNDINLEPADIPTSDGFSIENLIKRHGIIGAPEPIKRN